MAKRYLNTIVSRLKTRSPKTHVRPSNGSSIAEPLRPTFAFLNVAPAVVGVVALLSFLAFSVRVVFTSLEDNALRRARIKITKLI